MHDTRANAVGRSAMVLAAGLGLRMRPLTEQRPKPLVTVAGRPLIDHSIDALRRAGVTRAVVNMHHLADQVEEWAGRQQGIEIVLSDERGQLLDTGGGVSRALASLGPAPFFVMNSDSFWTEGGRPALQRMRDAWQPDRMDGLLLLAPMTAARGFSGAGDFHMDEDGRIARRGESETAPFAFAGTSLLHPRLFEEAPEGRFSLNLLFDRALARGRLFGLRHDGLWLHVGTPDAIAEAEAALAQL